MNYILKMLVLILFLIWSTQGIGQNKKPKSPKSPEKAIKEAEKKEIEREKTLNKELKEARKAHIDNQTKAVRKRIKKNLKKADRHNSNKKDPNWKRNGSKRKKVKK